MRDNIYAKIIGNMAFVIEGRNDNELPEVLIGGFTVFYPDPDVAIRSSDFFRSRKNGWVALITNLISSAPMDQVVA